MKPVNLHARRLAYGIAHTTLSGSILSVSKPPPRWWRWLVVAGVPGAGLLMLSIDWARVIAKVVAQ